MTQFNPVNADPRRIHGAEQMWAAASNRLDLIIATITALEPYVYDEAGNTDSSVLFDWMKAHLKTMDAGGAHDMTLVICAAAITRLVRAPRTDINDPLAQLDKELNGE